MQNQILFLKVKEKANLNMNKFVFLIQKKSCWLIWKDKIKYFHDW